MSETGEDKLDLAAQIESSTQWRKLQLERTGGKKRRRALSRLDLERLFDNQRHEMAEHLQHDNMYRMLDRFKAAPRSPRPSMSANMKGTA